MDMYVPQSRLERHARLLLRAYPAQWRAERGEEMLDTILQETREGRDWPSFLESASLVASGIRARAAANRRVPVGVAIRQASVLGLALYCVHKAGDTLLEVSYLPPHHYPVAPMITFAVAMLAVATLAWTGSRLAVLARAVVTVAAYGWWNSSDLFWITGMRIGLANLLTDVLPVATTLALLVLVTGRRARPEVGWLTFPGLSSALAVVALLMWDPNVVHAVTLSNAFLSNRATALLALGALLAIAWLVTDLRPAIGVAAFLAVTNVPQFLSILFVNGTIDTSSIDVQSIGLGLVPMAALTLLLTARRRHRSRAVR